MSKEQVYKYRRYDMSIDDYKYSTRYATMTQIRRIGAEPVYSAGAVIDSKHLKDGWTEKNFDPEKANG